MTPQALMTLAESQFDRMYAAERYIWAHPETGYREWGTQKYLADAFEALGYPLTMAGNIPGFYTDVDTGRPGPRLLIMGEMDSLIVTNHPECDPATGYVHACGHHAQAAALLGIAAALKTPGALEGLSGSIRLMAVPAEELIEIEFRESLRQKGDIRYFGGKVELMYRGFMDGCDLCLLVHTAGMEDKRGIFMETGNNGCITKSIEFQGVSSHAGGGPDKGINALYAANLGISAVNALRETFRDEDHIRFHPIMTRGGDAVNAIPHDVALESYVRAASLEAMTAANNRINRALAASAAAFGGNVLLHDRPGYMPLHNSAAMMDVAMEAAGPLLGGDIHRGEGWSTGCTDMGDMSMVMPTLHPYCSGAAGTGHGNDYRIAKPEEALTLSCGFQLILTHALLENGAGRAKKVVAEHKPAFESKADFFAAIDRLFMDKKAVEYREDGSILLI